MNALRVKSLPIKRALAEVTDPTCGRSYEVAEYGVAGGGGRQHGVGEEKKRRRSQGREDERGAGKQGNEGHQSNADETVDQAEQRH